MTHELSLEMTTDQMLKELSITFPSLWKRPLSEFGKSYFGTPGVWTGSDGGYVMQDGDPIFNTWPCDLEPPYVNGPVHEAFEAWLAARGWSWDRFDGATFFLIPNSSYDWLDASCQEQQAAVRQSAPGAYDPAADPCPF